MFPINSALSAPAPKRQKVAESVTLSSLHSDLHENINLFLNSVDLASFAASFSGLRETRSAIKWLDISPRKREEGCSKHFSAKEIDHLVRRYPELIHLSLGSYGTRTEVEASGFPLLEKLPLRSLSLSGVRLFQNDCSKRSGRSYFTNRISLISHAFTQTKMSKLQYLGLDKTNISAAGLSGLQGMQLRRLSLSGACISQESVSELAHLQICELDLSSTDLRWVSLAPIKSLSHLNLSYALFDAFEVFGHLQLETLDLTDVKINGEDLNHLQLMPLKQLTISSDCGLTEAQLVEFEQTMPECELVVD